ncbi:Endonuclease/Exonuclease/phosphatase family [Seminavis robusta]|uniref:Endonuclease/Exonuclease/phosphatase family n=1 Tax=Seminavis robusta TaxID=568900 RepID=A0A9N8E894_9STRA|nr:Endonuclease/Exonuclease/phosphatase family [Seminavis robusta]|eukprot:Sro603_g173960.1 Endonuclease/Exonuclease/phosphatase family (457) ;mRNA; r:31696-33178
MFFSTCRSRPVWLSLLAASIIGSASGQTEPRPWINEFHYDNIGTDIDEFIEVAAPADLDISNHRIVLYNGFYGEMYAEDATHMLSDFTVGDTVNGVTFYTKFFRPADCAGGSRWCGLQNGRDGFALAYFETDTTGRIEEFLSYEGSFTAKDGPAVNLTTTDIGVKQRTTTPLGYSISREGIGCAPDLFFWETRDTQGTPGTVNAKQTVTCEVVFINEFHYDNVDGGVGQFVEIAANVDDVAPYSIVLYNGETGMPYDAILLSSFEQGDTDPEGLTFYHYDFPVAGGGLVVNDPILVDGNEMAANASGIVLAQNDDIVLEFISYGGEFTASGGIAVNMTSTDIGVAESDQTPVGSSLQLQGVGCYTTNFQWTVVEEQNFDIVESGDTRGAVNIDQTIVCAQPVPTPAPTVEGGEEVDDLIAQDDDFLDDNIQVLAVTKSQSKVTYSEAGKPPEPVRF